MQVRSAEPTERGDHPLGAAQSSWKNETHFSGTLNLLIMVEKLESVQKKAENVLKMVKILSMETLKRFQSVYLISRRMRESTSRNPFPRKKRPGIKKSLWSRRERHHIIQEIMDKYLTERIVNSITNHWQHQIVFLKHTLRQNRSRNYSFHTRVSRWCWKDCNMLQF